MGQQIQIIGAGFAGLAAAYSFARRGYSVRVVETGQVGGLLSTQEVEFGLVESAANAFLANDTVMEVSKEIGVELEAPLRGARRRYIWRGGLRRWPLGFAATLRVGFFFLRFLLNRRPFAPRPQESVQAWGERCLGPEATEYLLAPGLSGIYAGDPRTLSASLILGRFFGSAPKGKFRGSRSPLKGMGAWVEGMRAYLEHKGVAFAREALPGPTIVALPPPAAARFLETRAPRLARLLSRIPMHSLVSATIFLPEGAVGIEGFGCLFPRREGLRVLGVLSPDRIFPGRVKPGFRAETWIFGGATDPGVVNLSEEELRALITQERAALFGPAKILACYSRFWPGAIPAYNLELERVLEEIRGMGAREGEYRLFGTYLGELGLGRVLAASLQLEAP